MAQDVGTASNNKQDKELKRTQQEFLNRESGVPVTDPSILGKLPIRAPEVNKDAGTSLRYPFEDSIKGDTDYVIFEFWEYSPPFGRGSDGQGAQNTEGTTGSPSYRNYNASVDGLKEAKTLGGGKLSPVLLYMPEDIQTMYSQKWGGAAFGSVTAGLIQAAGTNVDLSAAVDSTSGVIKSKAFDLLRQGINKVAGASVSENQFLGGVSGVILNPNTEMMYDGPELRTLDLTFKMVPTTSREAQEIKKICTTFKRASLPSFGGKTDFFGGSSSGLGGGNLLTIPKICTVKFMKGSAIHPYLPQYKAMAIANIAINYTPDGSYTTYADGSPVATQLKISLKEMKNIFSDEIEDQGGSY